MMNRKELNNSYNFVGNQTWIYDDFLIENLKKSRNLFEKNSLKSNLPIPRKFNVIGLLSGLPFSIYTQDKFNRLQNQIKDIISNKQIYLVEKLNYGIEYYVFKWPQDKDLNNKKLSLCKEIFYKILSKFKSFQIEINGFQINPDGCILMKGLPLNNEFLNIRNFIKQSYSPYESLHKQSNWMHIPLGRILDPVGKENFQKLKDFVRDSNEYKFNLEISSIHLIHEKRWYMKEKDYILTSKL